nr:hypothetical protein GCM10017745_56680 [Saccharothrix mutabilis subsp. capreolus]
MEAEDVRLQEADADLVGAGGQGHRGTTLTGAGQVADRRGGGSCARGVETEREQGRDEGGREESSGRLESHHTVSDHSVAGG